MTPHHQPEAVDRVKVNNNKVVDQVKVNNNSSSSNGAVKRTSTPRVGGIPTLRTFETKVMNLWISCLGLSLVMSLVSPNLFHLIPTLYPSSLAIHVIYLASGKTRGPRGPS